MAIRQISSRKEVHGVEKSCEQTSAHNFRFLLPRAVGGWQGRPLPSNKKTGNYWHVTKVLHLCLQLLFFFSCFYVLEVVC